MPKRHQHSYRITISPEHAEAVERSAKAEGIEPFVWLRLLVIRGLQPIVNKKKKVSS